MEKQTAVEWFAIQLYEQGYFNGSTPKSITNLDHLQEQAIQMEKKQKIKFAENCLDKALDLDIRTAFSNVEQYYNETFKTK